MFFDDRLATVLRQRATGEAGLRTQYRQLLDLLGKDRIRRGGTRIQSLVAAAWLRMDALAEAIPAERRAAMIREPGWRFRSPDLAIHLADQEPQVAAAALNRAELSVEDWAALIPRLPLRARGFLRLRRDLPLDVEALLERLGIQDRGLPAPTAAQAAAPETAEFAAPLPPSSTSSTAHETVAAARHPTAARRARQAEHPSPADRDETGRSEISALVERIAQFRRERSEAAGESEIAPRLPLGELRDPPERPVAGFGFVTDSGGRIEWASPEVAAMVIGTRIAARPGDDEAVQTEGIIERAFARRQPLVAAPFAMGGAPAIAGEWVLDAQPAFSAEGHFTGYVGRLRRDPDAGGTATQPDSTEADRLRQLLHELRTPVTAVQGYAEVIQQQLFGPAPHEYRALAAAIASDAARILAGFEELDRLARLETGAIGIAPGETDLARLAERILGQLEPVLAARGARLLGRLSDAAVMRVACDPEDAEALLWRIIASLGAACGEGETLGLRLDPVPGPSGVMARLECTLPGTLAREVDLFAATAKPVDGALNPGLFGTGFALRLARAEARAAGGTLERNGATLALALPLLTEVDERNSAGASGARGAG